MGREGGMEGGRKDGGSRMMMRGTELNVSVNMFSLDDAIFRIGTVLYKWRMWNKYDKNACRTYTIHK